LEKINILHLQKYLISIIEATKLFGGGRGIPPSTTDLLSPTSGDRKNKRTELDVRRL